MSKRAIGNKSDRNHSTLKDKIASIAIVIECLVLSLMIITLIAQMRESHLYDSYTVTQLLRQVEREDYCNLVKNVASNRAGGFDSSEYEEVYAVADYYYDCIRYKGYLAGNNEALISECYSDMQNDYDKMGDLKYVSESITEMLNIQ